MSKVISTKKIKLTQGILIELLYYNPDTGDFIWRKRSIKWFMHCKYPENHVNRWNTNFAGTKAGWVDRSRGYMKVSIFGKDYYLHRLAVLYMTGSWPKFDAAHSKGNKLDNRWASINDLEHCENCRDQRLPTTNTSGHIGVGFYQNRWRACIRYDGVLYSLGSFKVKQEAVDAREKAQREYNFHNDHGEKRGEYEKV